MPYFYEPSILQGGYGRHCADGPNAQQPTTITVLQAGRSKRKEKVTAEMRRKAALQRKMDREEKALGSRKEREEIFEVGKGGDGCRMEPCLVTNEVPKCITRS